MMGLGLGENKTGVSYNYYTLPEIATKHIPSSSMYARSQVLIQPSSHRGYSSLEYEAAGAMVTEDISDADAIMGERDGQMCSMHSIIFAQ